MGGWIWLIVPVVAIITPFAYVSFSKWIDYRKATLGEVSGSGILGRLAEAEEELAHARRRIENLESIVASNLLEAPAESKQLDR